MKRILLIWMLVLLIVPSFGQNRQDSLYVLAGEAYSDGNYEQALERYRQIMHDAYESADLYFNMGNAAFRSNKLGYAILYYKKALKLNPHHEEAENNLKYVSKYKEDHLDQVPELFIRSWVNAVYRMFSLKTWSWLALFFFALLLTGIILYVFSRQLPAKKIGFFSGFLGLVLFIVAFTASIERNKEINDPGRAVIVDPSVVVKSSPSLSGTDLFVLHEGTEIMIDERVGDWIEIRISDGRIGWIPSEVMVNI